MRLPETLVVHPCSVYYPPDETGTATADNSSHNCCDEMWYLTNWPQDSPFLNNANSLLSLGTGQKPSAKHFPLPISKVIKIFASFKHTPQCVCLHIFSSNNNNNKKTVRVSWSSSPKGGKCFPSMSNLFGWTRRKCKNCLSTVFTSLSQCMRLWQFASLQILGKNKRYPRVGSFLGFYKCTDTPVRTLS